MIEARQEFLADGDYLMLLVADAGHPAADTYIVALSCRAPKRVAGERTCRSFAPRHDHACVQSARERNRDRFSSTMDIPRKNARDHVAHLKIVGFGVKRFLLFPGLRIEVCLLLLEQAVAKNPGGSGRKQMNLFKQASVLQSASERNELPRLAGFKARVSGQTARIALASAAK